MRVNVRARVQRANIVRGVHTQTYISFWAMVSTKVDNMNYVIVITYTSSWSISTISVQYPNMIFDMDYTNVTVPTTWSIRTCPVQHVCETQHVFFARFEEFNSLTCSLVDVNILLTNGDRNIPLFWSQPFFCSNIGGQHQRFWPWEWQHFSTSICNSSGDSQDDHDNTGTPDPCGQHVPSVQSH